MTGPRMGKTIRRACSLALVVAVAVSASSVAPASAGQANWQMRAMGDSVTAGFGFLGDGTPMTIGQLFTCRPPDNLNNRCSSNSDNGPGYTGDPEWSKDFGLENNTSWAAQFANSLRPGGKPITTPGGFQNLAVTGSAPSDWLPGGPFNPQLEDIIEDDPELVAMTLGANPLLSTILFGDGTNCVSKQTVSDLLTCIAPFFQQVNLTGNLQKVYTALLNGTDDSNVVVFQYNLSIPWFTSFRNWQIETMIDYFNGQIASAVANTRQALPSKSSRLIMIGAQVDPNSPQPDLLPRFNIGVPPVSQQTWTAGYDCATGHLVDGPSHAPSDTQGQLKSTPGFCAGDPWVITTDTGIHPNATGYAQYARTLHYVAQQRGLLPPGPPTPQPPVPPAPLEPPSPNPPPKPDDPVTVRPEVDDLRLIPKRFRARSRRTPRRATGTTIGFSLTEPATVHFRVRRDPPRKNGGPPPRHSHRFTRELDGGFHGVAFTGRLDGRTFKPGRYQMIVRAIDAHGESSDRVVAPFRITPR